MDYSWFNPPSSQAKAFAWAMSDRMAPARAELHSLERGVATFRFRLTKFECLRWLWAYHIAHNWDAALDWHAQEALRVLNGALSHPPGTPEYNRMRGRPADEFEDEHA